MAEQSRDEHHHDHHRHENDHQAENDHARKESLAAFLVHSVMSDRLRSLHLETTDGHVNASFGTDQSSRPPQMHAGTGSFLHNDLMSRPQGFGEQSSFGNQHPDGSYPSQGQSFGAQQSFPGRPGWPGLSQGSQPQPQPHFHASQPTTGGFQTSQGSFGAPGGFGQFGTSQPSQPQMPQMPFGTQTSFGAPGGQFGSGAGTGATCCSAGGGACGGSAPGGMGGFGGAGPGGFGGPGAFTSSFNSSMAGQPSFGSQQQQQPGWGQGFNLPQSLACNPEALRSAVRQLCDSANIPRDAVSHAIESGRSVCGDPNCGCDACRYFNVLSTVGGLVSKDPSLLSAIHREPTHYRARM